jgi:hypothetical protein
MIQEIFLRFCKRRASLPQYINVGDIKGKRDGNRQARIHRAVDSLSRQQWWSGYSL